MTNYARLYRLGIRPWERYSSTAASSVAGLLDRVEAQHGAPGRALDLGCGRGLHTPLLARRGWHTVGVDAVPQAIRAARRRAHHGVRHEVGDVTALDPSLGRFDLFLDVGCFQGLDVVQRRAAAASITARANPGATLLLLAFQPGLFRPLIDGVSQEQIQLAFREWELEAVEEAPTAGLGFPMNTAEPLWYRLRRR